MLRSCTYSVIDLCYQGKGVEKKKIETFEDLRVWQQGIELVKQIYLITREGEISRDFGLRDQLRRAAVSVPTNVAFSDHLRWLVKAKRLRGKRLLSN